MNFKNPGRCLAAGWAGSSCSKDVCQECGVLPGRAGSSGWLSSGLASFSSSWVHYRGNNMAWKSSRLTSSWLCSPSRKSTPLALSLLCISEGELLLGQFGSQAHIWSEAVRSDHWDGGGNVSQRERRGLLLEEGTDGNWVKTTDATSYSPRLCSPGEKWKCNSSHFTRFL